MLRRPTRRNALQRDLDLLRAVEDGGRNHDLARGEPALGPEPVGEAEAGHRVEVEDAVDAVALLRALRGEQRYRGGERVAGGDRKAVRLRQVPDEQRRFERALGRRALAEAALHRPVELAIEPVHVLVVYAS